MYGYNLFKPPVISFFLNFMPRRIIVCQQPFAAAEEIGVANLSVEAGRNSYNFLFSQTVKI